jgi:hypothetical protein
VKATGDRDGGVPMMEGFLGGFLSLALSFFSRYGFLLIILLFFHLLFLSLVFFFLISNFLVQTNFLDQKLSLYSLFLGLSFSLFIFFLFSSSFSSNTLLA